MKDKTQKSNGYQSDDDNVRYKINTHYFNTAIKSPSKVIKKQEKVKNDDESVRYKFPTVLTKTKTEKKSKVKPKIKVNFWSNKQTSRLHSNEAIKPQSNHIHKSVIKPLGSLSNKAKKTSVVKVRKRVSFLPSPLFSDNHVPMVTVPDDLTIQLNEEEANDLREDLNLAYVNNSGASSNNPIESVKRKGKTSSPHISPKSKRKRSPDNIETRTQGNENELEFFSKYVVQKLRRMETNQRIYSENLINTVLMLGQLGKLNGKSKIAEI